MLKSLVLITFAIPLAGAPPPPAGRPVETRPSREDAAAPGWMRFALMVQPLQDADWWGAVAVRCGLRGNAWLSALDRTIDAEAAHAAHHVWQRHPEDIQHGIARFRANLSRAHRKALAAPRSECRVLSSSDQLSSLDGMAKAGGW